MNVIPSIIVQTSRDKPEKYIIDKILSKCPGWYYAHFTDDEAIEFFEDNYFEEFKNIVDKFRNMPSGAHKGDLFRYFYLYVNGGVYIDGDAMIEVNIDDVIKDYSFFSVYSGVPKTIFQGFIGSTPRNDILYKALQDAYNIDVKKLKEDYHLLCKNLFDIVKNDTTNKKIKLYNERFVDGYAETYNEKSETILKHYYCTKIIPK